MRVRLKGLSTLVALVALMALVGGVLPAHADPVSGPPTFPEGGSPAEGHAEARIALTPHLPLFPCGTSFPQLEIPNKSLDAVKTYPDWDSDKYDPCYGNIYQPGGLNVNNATLNLEGVNLSNNTPYSVKGSSGVFDAHYTYAEPCQISPSGSKSSTTGEAIGWTKVTASAGGLPIGVYGLAPVTSAVFQAKFWWSRVGVTAVVRIADAYVELVAGGQTIVLRDTGAVGLATAIFIPAGGLPDCNNPNHKDPNAVVIVSVAAGS